MHYSKIDITFKLISVLAQTLRSYTKVNLYTCVSVSILLDLPPQSPSPLFPLDFLPISILAQTLMWHDFLPTFDENICVFLLNNICDKFI